MHVFYQRYVIASASGEELHGNFQRVQRVWDNIDGTALYKVEADSVQWMTLNGMTGITVLPSLHEPVDRQGIHGQYFWDHGIKIEQGDTTLVLLRKLRTMNGLDGSIIIDSYN